MLQYLQSWFPGWGGWSGQQTPEGKLGEGLSAEQHEQWTPEEILGKVVAGLHISPPGCSGGRCLVHLSVLLLTRPSVFQTETGRRVSNSSSHVLRGSEGMFRERLHLRSCY